MSDENCSCLPHTPSPTHYLLPETGERGPKSTHPKRHTISSQKHREEGTPKSTYPQRHTTSSGNTGEKEPQKVQAAPWRNIPGSGDLSAGSKEMRSRNPAGSAAPPPTQPWSGAQGPSSVPVPQPQPGSASSPVPSLSPVESQLEGLPHSLHIVQDVVSTQGHQLLKLLGLVGEVHHAIGSVWPVDGKVPTSLLLGRFSFHTCDGTWREAGQGYSVARSCQSKSPPPQDIQLGPWVLLGPPSQLSPPPAGARPMCMLSPGRKGQLGPPRGRLSYIILGTAPSSPAQGSVDQTQTQAPLTWGQVCAEGTVDQGEVQYDG